MRAKRRRLRELDELLAQLNANLKAQASLHELQARLMHKQHALMVEQQKLYEALRDKLR